MGLFIQLEGGQYVAERRDDNRWYVLTAAEGEQVVPDGFDRLSDATEAAKELE